MYIKRVFVEGDRRPHYDVFLGDGWEGWTRVRKHHWGVQPVAGDRLPKDVLNELNERLAKK